MGDVWRRATPPPALPAPASLGTLLIVRRSANISGVKSTIPSAERIRQHLQSLSLGEVFTSADLLHYGTRASIDQTLSRLVKAGEICRLSPGIFTKPEVSRYLGQVMPDPIKVVEALARHTGAIVQAHGSVAALRLGLTKQVALKSVFLTSGPSRRIKFGNSEIRLLHTSTTKMALAGTPAGLALSALWYLGKDAVTSSTIEIIRTKLAPEDFQALCAAKPLMPAWMSDFFT